MGLMQVATHTVESGSEVQTVKLESCVTDNSMYFLSANNICVGADGGSLDVKPLVGSTSDDTSNINIAWMDLKTSGAYQDFGNTGQDMWRVTDGCTTAPNKINFVMTLFNWYSSTEWAHITMEVTSMTSSQLRGYQQAGTKEETTSFNGIQFYTNQTGGGGFQAGSQFTLYKVV